MARKRPPKRPRLRRASTPSASKVLAALKKHTQSKVVDLCVVREGRAHAKALQESIVALQLPKQDPLHFEWQHQRVDGKERHPPMV